MIRKRPKDQPQPQEPQLRADRAGIAAHGDVIASVTQHIEADQAYVLPPEAHAPIPPSAAGSAGIANIPRHTTTFVGRGPELGALEAKFETPGEVLVQAVHGLGGVGKSTLSAEWAAGRQEPVRWWITADTEPAVSAGVAALARALQPALAALPAEVQADRAIRWLADNPAQWLLVLDNVESPAHVRPLLDRIPGGRILITTRLASGWHTHAAVLHLDVLTPDDAATLFTRILTQHGPREVPAADVDALCTELGHLALAVEQAAAYCAETGVTPHTYLDQIRSAPTTMYAAAAEGGDPARTTARIWRLTLDRIASTPLTGDLLRILAWYAPEGIPRDLLYPVGPAPEVDAALGKLAAYNMIDIGPDGTLSVHRLVQAVARTPDPEDPYRGAGDIDWARDMAAELLVEAFPAAVENPANWPQCQRLLPHTDALTSRHSPALDTEATALSLSLAARYRVDQGSLSFALEGNQRALRSRQQVLGPDHPDTLISLNNLAHAYESAGDVDKAIALFKTNLEDRQRVLGPNHPDTLLSRNNLAGAYESAGDLNNAIPLYETTLDDSQRMLGPDHPRTLLSRNNLAYAYESAGDLNNAITLYETTLEDRQRILGPNHPDTLTSRNNLASAYESAGDLNNAIALFEATLEDRQRILGPNHPDTLNSNSSLASAYQAAGDLDKAIHLHETNFDDSQRILGPNHPHTLLSRNNLASAYQAAGDLDKAIHLHETNLEDRQWILGPDHPGTLTSRNNLASAYQAAGDLDKAIHLYEAALARAEQALSPGHPLTKALRENLAHARSL